MSSGNTAESCCVEGVSERRVTQRYAGQMTFATDKLLAQHGLDRGKADAPWAQTELLVSLDDICAAFWDTAEGRAMRDQLDNHPVDKCAAVPRWQSMEQWPVDEGDTTRTLNWHDGRPRGRRCRDRRMQPTADSRMNNAWRTTV